MGSARCQVCGLWPAQAVCVDCMARFAAPRARCVSCATPLAPGVERCGACLREPPALAACVAAVDYAYPWSLLLRRFKFGDEPAWARLFAALLRRSPGASALWHGADLAIPIPLTRRRLAERGYDQSWQLLKALRHADAPHDVLPDALPDALIKLDDLPPQHQLDRAERLRNALRAFTANPAVAARWQGRHVLLLDDVMTTGATLNAAAEVLLRAGAARVSAMVFARTPP